MPRPSARPRPLFIVLVLAFALGLTACSGASEALSDVVEVANEAAEEVSGEGQDETGNAVPGEFRVENDSEVTVCRLVLTDSDEPDLAGVDLIAEHSATPMAPGDARVYPQGEHLLMDDHNLPVTAEGCDGEVFDGYAFSFIEHGGAYSVLHQASMQHPSRLGAEAGRAEGRQGHGEARFGPGFRW